MAVVHLTVAVSGALDKSMFSSFVGRMSLLEVGACIWEIAIQDMRFCSNYTIYCVHIIFFLIRILYFLLMRRSTFIDMF